MEIENFKVESKGQVVATFDIFLERMELTFRKFRVVRGTKGLFASAPSFKDENDDFIPYVEFAGNKNVAFKKMLMELLEPYISELKKLYP